MFGKYDFRVESRLQVVAAQPGKVFDNHDPDLSILHQIQHPLEIRAIVVRPGVPVVHEILAVGESPFLGKLSQQRFLRLDRNAVAAVLIVTAQSAIQRGNFDLLFYCSPNKNVNQAAYFVRGAKKKEAMREGVSER